MGWTRWHDILIAISALLLALAGCRSPVDWAPPAPGEPVTVVYLVNHGMHAGLVMPRTDAVAGRDFADAAWLEVGWGDRAYYQAPAPTTADLLRAALWPTPSTLHVVGFSGPVDAYFPRGEILRFDLSVAEGTALAAFIHAAFARDAQGQPQPLGPGLYGTSRFYAARQRYHLFENCNEWAARALRTAGLPLWPAEVLTTGDLFKQTRPLGTVVRAGG